MTIELLASKKALVDSSSLDVNDVSDIPDHYTTAWLGIDLSALGAQSITVPGEYGIEEAKENLNFPRLAASVKAALQGGLDFVSLDKSFQNRSDQKARDEVLDGIRAAVKLSEIMPDGGLCVEMPPELQGADTAIKHLSEYFEKWTSIAVDLNADTDFKTLEKVVLRARNLNVHVMGIAADADFVLENASEIVRLVNAIRLKVEDPQVARKIRFALLAEAEKLDTQILVFVDLGVVISASVRAAEEREMLISQINNSVLFAGISSAIGTVYDVADAVESWISIGAADGIIFIPASLPTDLASILRGVLPLLQERSKLDTDLPRLPVKHSH